MSNVFINYIKIFYRLIVYKAEWKKHLREFQIRRYQKIEINKLNTSTRKMILFFIPGANYFTGRENISGGLISIISIVKESASIHHKDDTAVLCATYYNSHLIYKLTSFENNITIFSPKIISDYFDSIEELILHTPELFVGDFVDNHLSNKWLKKIKKVNINILNQSIELMPNIEYISRLKKTFNQVTVTTAHDNYCTQEFRSIYDVPLHKLSTYVTPEIYNFINYMDKDDTILFSPDNLELAKKLIELLSVKKPNFNFKIIKELTYEQYKLLIEKSKFVITLGEGLDNYFIETYFSGGISFAIGNLNFFNEKYLDLPCLFDVHDELANQLSEWIDKYDCEGSYLFLNKKVYNLLAEDYCYKSYQDNLRKFYNKEYTYA